MLNGLGRFFSTGDESTSSAAEYDPVYGLPIKSVERWLARNPRLREEYEAELRRRMDSPARLAHDRGHQVQPQGFRPEVDGLA